MGAEFAKWEDAACVLRRTTDSGSSGWTVIHPDRQIRWLRNNEEAEEFVENLRAEYNNPKAKVVALDQYGFEMEDNPFRPVELKSRFDRDFEGL